MATARSIVYQEIPKAALCVDLDGSLLATDVLWESIVQLLRHKPHFLMVLPFWLLKGKAGFKRKIAQSVQLDVALLPYREEVLAMLRAGKDAGREVVLVTASDHKAVALIAEHLGVFSEVIASDGVVNLAGENKRLALEDRFGAGRFDYVGNSKADLPAWRSANNAIMVGPSRRLLAQTSRVATVTSVVSARQSRTKDILRALRCHQWVKNVLVFVPLLMAHRVFDLAAVANAFCAFAAFSLCASGVYVLNDLADLEADRQHPRKKLRPFASGALPISLGFAIWPGMIGAAFLLSAVMLPSLFLAGLGFYLVATTVYSLYLKRKPVADVITLAGLYTLRVLIGGVAINSAISTWLLAFSVFLFLSLAYVKRFAELNTSRALSQRGIPGRAYTSVDGLWMGNMGSSSGYLSVLVLALYINSQEVIALYHRPQILWLVCPPLLYWISRMWLLAHKGELDEDPIVFAAKDRVSYAVAIIMAAAIVAAL